MPSATTTLRIEGVELEVGIQAGASPTRLAFRYRLHNGTGVALAVFDRGDSHAVATRRLKAGAVAPPAFEVSATDLTLSHVAAALAEPTPTVPRIALAVRVDAGATLDGRFDYSIDADVRRLRWCLGTLPFDAATFIAVDGSEPPVWRAPLAAAQTQRLLCTPWYLVEERRFSAD
ncbi:MAG TPA: hypothetical protein PKO41_11015 [Dokdonella sp.]|nr:hypothetical protein [Dokdonella sp.]